MRVVVVYPSSALPSLPSRRLLLYSPHRLLVLVPLTGVALREKLLAGIKDMEEVYINGNLQTRVPHNLNLSFNFVEGESLIMAIKEVAVSSGSACTSASLEPSYVLRALGRNDELAHSSIRFSFGRFTTDAEVEFLIQLLHDKIGKLRELSPLWEMYKEGVDLNTVEWTAH